MAARGVCPAGPGDKAPPIRTLFEVGRCNDLGRRVDGGASTRARSGAHPKCIAFGVAVTGNCQGARVSLGLVFALRSLLTLHVLSHVSLPRPTQDQLNSLRFHTSDEFLSALAKVFAASAADLGAQASAIVTDLERACSDLGLSSTAFGDAYRAHCSAAAQNGSASVAVSPLLAASVSACSAPLISANQPASSGTAVTLQPSASKSQAPSAASASSSKSTAPLHIVSKELRQSKLSFAPAAATATAVAAIASQSPTFPSSRLPDPAAARVSEPALPAAPSAAALKRAAAADKVANSPLKNCISNPIASTQRLASVSSAQSTSASAPASAFSTSPFASVYLKASATAQNPGGPHRKSVSRSDELRHCLAPALSTRMYSSDVVAGPSGHDNGGAHDQLHSKDLQCHWGSVACHASAATTTGSVRDLNQDRFCLVEMPGTGVVFGVFDGMCFAFDFICCILCTLALIILVMQHFRFFTRMQAMAFLASWPRSCARPRFPFVWSTRFSWRGAPDCCMRPRSFLAPSRLPCATRMPPC